MPEGSAPAFPDPHLENETAPLRGYDDAQDRDDDDGNDNDDDEDADDVDDGRIFV